MSCAPTAAPAWRGTRCRAAIEMRDSLPMSAVGKILYRVLRDEVQARR